MELQIPKPLGWETHDASGNQEQETQQGERTGFVQFEAGWVSSSVRISKLYLQKAVRHMGVMFWWNDRRWEARSITTSPVVPTDQRQSYLDPSETSMTERAGGQGLRSGAKQVVHKVKYESISLLLPRVLSVPIQWGSQGPQEVFLRLIWLPLFLPFRFTRDSQCDPTCAPGLASGTRVPNSILEDSSSELGFLTVSHRKT